MITIILDFAQFSNKSKLAITIETRLLFIIPLSRITKMSLNYSQEMSIKYADINYFSQCASVCVCVCAVLIADS